MTDLKSQVATLIRSSRIGRGMTQEQLAEKADMSTQALSALENGRSFPSLQTLVILGEALGFSLSEVVSSNRVSESRLALESHARSLIVILDDDMLQLAIKTLEAFVEHSSQRA